MATQFPRIANIHERASDLIQEALNKHAVLQRKPGHNQLVIHDHLIKGYRRVCVPMFPGNGGAAA